MYALPDQNCRNFIKKTVFCVIFVRYVHEHFVPQHERESMREKALRKPEQFNVTIKLFITNDCRVTEYGYCVAIGNAVRSRTDDETGERAKTGVPIYDV